jgi:Sec-independent protein translocase protein TatA
MLSLSPVKMLVIVAAVVILLGPDKLPEVAHKLGSTWQSLRRFQQRIEAEVRDALPDLPSTDDLARMARNPVTVLNQLADRAGNPARPDPGPDPGPDVRPATDPPPEGVDDHPDPVASSGAPSPAVAPIVTARASSLAPIESPNTDPSLN